MTKFRSDNHIAGKVYDLTQENMNAMLSEIDTLTAKLSVAKAALEFIAPSSPRCDSAYMAEITLKKIRG